MIRKYSFVVITILCLCSCSAFCLKTEGCSSPLYSKEPKYPVSAIPEELQKNADQIIREYTLNIEVKSLNSLVINVHRVVTVLRESGMENIDTRVHYNQNSKVNSIHAIFYDSDGFEIEHSKSSEISDESAIRDGAFYTDERLKRVKITRMDYPFTLDFSYEVVIHKLLFFPVWCPQDDYRSAVEYSKLTVTAENDLLPRFKELNISQPAVIEHTKDLTTVTYTVKDIPAIESEIYSIPFQERVPTVHIAPNDYRTQGENFDFRTWKSFGLWVYHLIEGRDIIPEKIKNQVLERIKDKQSKLDKIREIYKYVQQNTRFVSVEIGIGGWQPMEASRVAETGYGDCKGLVNYTKALLSVAGINSYYTLVNAGAESNDILSDFPSKQFNHAILCIPMENDTIWLECTNQSIPFGFLGSFTANRHVLLITPDGGILAKTPEYPGKKNTLIRKIDIELDTNGYADIVSTSHFKGLRYDDVEEMENMAEKDMGKILLRRIKASAATIQKISYTYNKDRDPEAIENIKMSIRSFASRTGKRLFLPFNLFGDISANINELTSRKTPIFFRYSYIDTDTVQVHLPSGFQVESLPKVTEISTQFGNYSLRTTQKGDVLTFVHVVGINAGRYAPESFTQLASFLQTMSKEDKSNAVLIKK